jgi:hypothetical protein
MSLTVRFSGDRARINPAVKLAEIYQSNGRKETPEDTHEKGNCA